MTKFKRIMLTLCTIVGITLASVIGFACFAQKTSIGGGTNNGVGEVVDNLDNGKITYRAGEVVLQKGGNSINYTYSPSIDSKSAYTVAYEYSFENTMTKAVAINLKSIDTTGVTVSYAYSDSKLDLTGDIEGETTFRLQQLPNKGDEVYIYVLVSPTNVSIPTTFTTSIVWYYGLPQELIIEGANGTTTTKTIVNGQELTENDIPHPTAPEGYYFDTYFLDKDHTKLAGDNFRVGKTLYARYANLPSDWLALDETSNTYYIKRGTSALPTNLVIPASVDYTPVTYIKDTEVLEEGVFYSQNITNVELPNTLTSIGGYSFSYSTLVDIKVSTNLTSIETRAFYYCRQLKSIDLSVCKNLTNLGEYGLFQYCVSMQSIKMPLGITIVGEAVFCGCNEMVNINISELSDLSIIKEYAFMYCYELEYINLANSKIETIGGKTFRECTNLKSVKLPKGLTSIGEEAFYYCSNLGEVDLSGTSVTTIGDYGFWGCRALTRVLTSPNLTTIGTDAFRDCNALSEVYDLSTNLEITRFSTNNGYIGAYAEVVNTDINEESRIEKIDGVAYYNGGDSVYVALTPIDRYSVTSIKVSSKVTTITSSAFAYCPNLTTVDLTSCNKLVYIDSYVFAYDAKLISVTIPKNVEEINRYSFYSCTSLTSITFANTNGWYIVSNQSDAENRINGTIIDLTNASQNAIWFRETSGYYDYYLYKVN